MGVRFTCPGCDSEGQEHRLQRERRGGQLAQACLLLLDSEHDLSPEEQRPVRCTKHRLRQLAESWAREDCLFEMKEGRVPDRNPCKEL